ncbi:cholinesterase-like isoform X2 [Xenia sp. Carnegie-2017]|uniref:cholinesterase-like isoform X2 n=1 Tax=Xenia sp. Carnegie-2017 TaxID=2897299 RepID=UPI001F047B93|nr:cholinesterase-like isoform X2 [Xenia sp. Carnegie-2017]
MNVRIIQSLLLIIQMELIHSIFTGVVETKSGKVRGLLQKSSFLGIKIQKFLNIPYAEAPVGKLRFEKPQPKKPWNGILNSTDVTIACFQRFIKGWNLTEDCLILNVWSPYPTPKNAAVMVYIHGGSFRSGSYDSESQNGANIVAIGNVILVTLNYRLSLLGFLSKANSGVKENLGLFDQRLAMKWVKENIAAFGGNPDAITLFGLSAGAASVSAHTLSPGSWKYFDRVILQSGNMLMNWTLSTESQAKTASETFLKSVNCANATDVLQCLKTKITQQTLQRIYSRKPFIFEAVWTAPTVDGDFLKDHPQKLFATGQVKPSPIILGVTKDEMFYRNDAILYRTRDPKNITKIFQENLEKIFPRNSEMLTVARSLYSSDCTQTFIEAFRPLVDLQSDLAFTCPIKQEAILRTRFIDSSNVYLYRYSYSSPVPYRAFPRGMFGFAAHGSDSLSVYGIPLNNSAYPEEDKILSKRIILYFTNFAKNGNPNIGTTKLPLVSTLPRWPPHSKSGQEYLDMRSLSQMVVERKIRHKYCQFWSKPEEFLLSTTNISSRKTTSQLILIVVFFYNMCKFL